MKTKKQRKSVFAVLVTILLFIIVAATLTVNILFSGENVPKIAGYYLYMQESDEMEPDIPQNSLVLAKAEETKSLTAGNKVLCYLSDGNLALRVIYNITVNETDGSTNYYPGTALEQGSELTIPRSNIFAICKWQSQPLYQFVVFATSVKGLLSLLVLPCVILIVMLLYKIAGSSKDDMDDEEFMFDDEKSKNSKGKSKDPLFDPEHASIGDASHEMKKSSILENFEKKEVDENSPYQKAVQERTMKFRIQQENLDDAKKQETLSSASRSETQVFASPTAEDAAVNSVQEMGRTAAVEETTNRAPEKDTDAPTSIPTPNIDDIVRPSELHAARTGQKINPEIAASESIDELLRVLEAEKKKL